MFNDTSFKFMQPMGLLFRPCLLSLGVDVPPLSNRHTERTSQFVYLSQLCTFKAKDSTNFKVCIEILKKAKMLKKEYI